MQAISVIPKNLELRIVDHDEPQLASPSHVKVKTIEVGVCGTDREICRFVYGTPPAGSDYLILGHESIGEVVEIGSEVDRFKVGDLVAVSVRRPCPDPECHPCQADLQDFCVNGQFTERGIKEEHGYMTEYFVEDQKFLYSVDSRLRDVAVLTEPLTIAEKALAQVDRIQTRLPWRRPESSEEEPGRGLRAVVLGAGPIGILGAMALKVRGYDTFVYSRSKAPNPKAELVESFGVPYISARQVNVSELAERVGNIDLVYEAVGVPEIAFQTLEVLGTNGAYVFTGIPSSGAAISVQGREIMRNVVLKNQLIIGPVNADPESFRTAIADLGKFDTLWPEALRKVISGRHHPDAYRKLLMDRSEGIKQVISFDV